MQLILPVSLTPRSQGVHQSAIIRCIATESGILKPEWAEELTLADSRTITDEVAIARICMGLAWEEWYIHTQLPEVVDHPGEMLLDGVYMTPDGMELTTLILDGRNRHELMLHEVKLTYKSINTVSGRQDSKDPHDWNYWAHRSYDSMVEAIGPMSSQWMWLAQTKGYAKAAGTRFVTLHVLYVCGDYSWPMRPIPYTYVIEFTQLELDQNWDLMLDYYQTHQHLIGDVV